MLDTRIIGTKAIYLYSLGIENIPCDRLIAGVSFVVFLAVICIRLRILE